VTLGRVLLALLCLATTAHAQRPATPISPPVVIESSRVEPSYPDSARRLKIYGTTTMRVQVLANGVVGEVSVEQSAGHPDLDRSATDAVRRWRFEPARRGTEPVAVLVRLTMTFKRPDDPDRDLERAVKVGVVTTVDGNATVNRVGGPDAVPIKVNAPVYLQDSIATGEAARIEIRLGDTAEVALGERSKVTMSEALVRRSLDLETGHLIARVNSGETKIDVRTPNAVATLRGDSRVRVEAMPGNITHVDVLDGTISVAANVDFRNPLLYRGTPPSSIDLRAGQGITITGEVAGAIRAARGASTK
jgi:TonB family protein